VIQVTVMVGSELYTLLLSNNFSKMETRKDGGEEYTQFKRKCQEWQQSSTNETV
jgi:hypothetical protein